MSSGASSKNSQASNAAATASSSLSSLTATSVNQQSSSGSIIPSTSSSHQLGSSIQSFSSDSRSFSNTETPPPKKRARKTTDETSPSTSSSSLMSNSAISFGSMEGERMRRSSRCRNESGSSNGHSSSSPAAASLPHHDTSHGGATGGSATSRKISISKNEQQNQSSAPSPPSISGKGGGGASSDDGSECYVEFTDDEDNDFTDIQENASPHGIAGESLDSLDEQEEEEEDGGEEAITNDGNDIEFNNSSGGMVYSSLSGPLVAKGHWTSSNGVNKNSNGLMSKKSSGTTKMMVNLNGSNSTTTNGHTGPSVNSAFSSSNGTTTGATVNMNGNGRLSSSRNNHNNRVMRHRVRRKSTLVLSSMDQEVVRIISQHLNDIGLKMSARVLMQESGCRLDSPTAASFKAHVLGGDWQRAIDTLSQLGDLIESQANEIEMKFLLLEQKYLHLLYNDNRIEALKVLQTELTPLNHNQSRVHQLSSYLMKPMSMKSKQKNSFTKTTSNGVHVVQKLNNNKSQHHSSTSKTITFNKTEIRQKDPSSSKSPIDNPSELDRRKELMERLQHFLPSSAMLPPRRLRHLLHQSVQYQHSNCLFHNVHDDEDVGLKSLPLLRDPLSNNSLSVDHVCLEADFPSQTAQILTDHTEEVLFCAFSPSGLRFASASKDSSVIVYELDVERLKLRRMRHLDRSAGGAGGINSSASALSSGSQQQQGGVSFFAWSPDSCKLAVCGVDDCEEICIWNVESGLVEAKISHSTEDSLSCVAWSPDGTRIACGGVRGQFYQCDTEGVVIDSWEGIRVLGLQYRKSSVNGGSTSKTVIAADTHHRIRSYNFDTLTDVSLFQEDHGIMSFTLSSSNKYALLNISNQGLHLWDMEGKCLMRKFAGVTQGYYTIYSTFGGVDDNFIASGSEDGKIFIFHVKRDDPILQLTGHSKTVNSVCWNPLFPHIFASASDDTTVRLWAPPNRILQAAAHQKTPPTGRRGGGSFSGGGGGTSSSNEGGGGGESGGDTFFDASTGEDENSGGGFNSSSSMFSAILQSNVSSRSSVGGSNGGTGVGGATFGGSSNITTSNGSFNLSYLNRLREDRLLRRLQTFSSQPQSQVASTQVSQHQPFELILDAAAACRPRPSGVGAIASATQVVDLSQFGGSGGNIIVNHPASSSSPLIRLTSPPPLPISSSSVESGVTVSSSIVSGLIQSVSSGSGTQHVAAPLQFQITAPTFGGIGGLSGSGSLGERISIGVPTVMSSVTNIPTATGLIGVSNLPSSSPSVINVSNPTVEEFEPISANTQLHHQIL